MLKVKSQLLLVLINNLNYVEIVSLESNHINRRKKFHKPFRHLTFY